MTETAIPFDWHVVGVILACALVTYLTRIGGDLLLSRLDTIPPRVAAALDAVPAAVITALVVPPALSGGPAEIAALSAAALASVRLPGLATVAIGLGTLLALRHAGF